MPKLCVLSASFERTKIFYRYTFVLLEFLFIDSIDSYVHVLGCFTTMEFWHAIIGLVGIVAFITKHQLIITISTVDDNTLCTLID